jgi:hypothetical protein
MWMKIREHGLMAIAIGDGEDTHNTHNGVRVRPKRRRQEHSTKTEFNINFTHF